MAIYNRPADPYSSLSASLGSSVGGGLGNLFRQISERKRETHRKTARANEVSSTLSELGVPSEIAEKIGYLPEDQQKMFFDRFLGSGAFGAQQPEQQDISAMLGGDQLGQQEAIPMEQAPELQQQEDGGFGNILSELLPTMQNRIQKQLGIPGLGAMGKPFKPIAKTAPVKREIPEGASPMAKRGMRLQAKPTRRKTFRELLATPRPTSADINKAEDMEFKRKKFSHKIQKDIDKSTQKTYDNILTGSKDARANDMRLGRMKVLNEKGRLSSPAFSSILNTIKHGLWGVGIDLKFLQTADSQEFDKLSKDFLKNAKSIFGSRVTEGEIRMFLETIPTLSQTKAGRTRVIRNMKMLNEAPKIRNRAMLDIIQRHGGERPKNMRSIINTKVGPQLDKLYEKFKSGTISSAKGLFSRAYDYLNK